ncbi:MAG: Rrf2 family transcriptional regulator [Gemmatimonadota bacterium]
MSEGVEWAVHCLSVLASAPEGRALPARRLAEVHGVPTAYLTKHLQKLAAQGIVSSSPGPRGGFVLARPANEITLLDVVEAVDGAEPAFRCAEIRQRGPTAVEAECYQRPCGIAAAFARADLRWREELRETTLAMLVADIPNTVHPRQLKAAETWLAEVFAD